MEEKNKDPKKNKKKPKVIKANTKEGKKKYEERAKRLAAEQKGGLKSKKQSAKKPSKRVNKSVGISPKNPISIENGQVPGGFQMNVGGRQIDSPTNFKTKDAMLMMQSPMGMHYPGHPDPKKKKKATMTTGEKGGFVQKSQGPVTGGVINTLDEVVMTVDKDKKQPKSSKQTKKPKVKSIYKKRIRVNAPYLNNAGYGNSKQNRTGRSGIGKLIASISPFENQWVGDHFLGYNRQNPLVEKVYKRRTPKQIKRMKKRGITFTKKKK